MAKDWFDKHVVVMTLDDDKKKEKAIKSSLKKVVYNTKPDPITSVKTYKIDANGKRVLVKEKSAWRKNPFGKNHY